MKIKLIAITEPFCLSDKNEKLTPEQFIVYIARVSNPNNQLNTETGSKLIRYLIKHNHWSPLEHVSCTFEIRTSRAIAAQILRHRSFTFQEFSQRYSTVTGLEPTELRMQGKTNRQVGDEPLKIADNVELFEKIDKLQDSTLDLYNELIEKGVARESARMILPLNTATTMYMTGTLRSWIHYLELRCTEHTQKEHRDIALNIKKDLAGYFPEVFKALEEINAR